VAGLIAATEDEVTSPTFTLLHEYGKGGDVFHGDLYRIESFADFETLGVEDIFARPAVVILEWSEKFPLKTPWPEIRVRLEHLGGDARRIAVL
jgi:tRNA threonylcarbamoyladenosine biosynthesis protein TsaE